jgi:two-component system, chemotaxis family, CheB/CheR fusion protein
VNSTSPDPAQPSQSLYVVGIGSSAGGIPALEEFFAHMPADSGAAFVVIQHFPPDFKSKMAEVLHRRTAMAIYSAEEGMLLEPNSIYLLPPGKNLTIQARRLHLLDQPGEPQPNFTIDLFFNALAADCGTEAIGIVLSGVGSDGSYGLRSIHEQGGVTLVQEPSTAEWDGMPKSAIETGAVHRVLPPRDLAQLLDTILRAPLPGLNTVLISNLVQSSSLNLLDETDDTLESFYLQRVARILAKDNRVDFSHYKSNTLTRRIQRRLLLTGYRDIEAYIEYLKQSAEERETLRGSLLISVTRFFRDELAWCYLENEIIPQLFQDLNPLEELRCWVAACATGEEAKI